MAEEWLIAEGLKAGLEQQLVARRHRPRALVDVERDVEITAGGGGGRFGRHLRRRRIVAQADPVRRAGVTAGAGDGQRRALAAVLILRVVRHAALTELRGDAADKHLAILD